MSERFLKPPPLERGPLAWTRRRLFNTWYNAILTLGALYLMAIGVKAAIGWMMW